MLTKEQQQAIEQRINRRLTPSEVFRGEIDRRPATGPRVVISSDSKQVAQAERDALIANIEKAQKAADQEAFDRLSPAQKKLEIAKDVARRAMAARAKFDAARAAAAKLRDPDPATAAQLQRLDALREKVAFDGSWSFEEFAVFDEARNVLAEKPLDEAQKFIDTIFDLKLKKDRAEAKGLREQAAVIEQQLAGLRKQADDLDPAPEPPNVNLSEIDGAWDTYWEAKKAFGAESPEATAALAAWNGAIDASGGIRAVNAAEAAAKAQAEGGAS